MDDDDDKHLYSAYIPETGLVFYIYKLFNYFGMNNILSPSSHEAYNVLEK